MRRPALEADNRPRPLLCRRARPGSNLQARGFSIKPSATPSRRSQSAMTARWMTGSFAGGIALSGVARSARSFQTNAVNKRDQLFAGAPARMPLKSSGKRCASISASRPPSEQPLK